MKEPIAHANSNHQNTDTDTHTHIHTQTHTYIHTKGNSVNSKNCAKNGGGVEEL
jgi:hypothetical protein